MTITQLEQQIELALENSDHHTLTECAITLKEYGLEDMGEELLTKAKKMKQKEYDEYWGYDEAKDNGEL